MHSQNLLMQDILQLFRRGTANIRSVTEAEFGELFNSAYGDAASMNKAESGFRKSGIWPYNRNVFTYDDFLLQKQLIVRLLDNLTTQDQIHQQLLLP